LAVQLRQFPTVGVASSEGIVDPDPVTGKFATGTMELPLSGVYPRAAVTSAEAIVPQAGAALTLPVPVCVRNCLAVVVLPLRRVGVPLTPAKSVSPSVVIGFALPPLPVII
jgi:hypothetical protein